MLESTGVLICNPKAKSIPKSEWWLILQCCPELSRYYRKQILQFTGISVQKPAWDTHISITRGEEPSNKQLWEALNGFPLPFTYENQLYTNDKYYWLNAYCDTALDIRERLGLPRQSKYNLHLTIGINT